MYVSFPLWQCIDLHMFNLVRGMGILKGLKFWCFSHLLLVLSSWSSTNSALQRELVEPPSFRHGESSLSHDKPLHNFFIKTSVFPDKAYLTASKGSFFKVYQEWTGLMWAWHCRDNNGIYACLSWYGND